MGPCSFWWVELTPNTRFEGLGGAHSGSAEGSSSPWWCFWCSCHGSCLTSASLGAPGATDRDLGSLPLGRRAERPMACVRFHQVEGSPQIGFLFPLASPFSLYFLLLFLITCPTLSEPWSRKLPALLGLLTVPPILQICKTEIQRIAVAAEGRS